MRGDVDVFLVALLALGFFRPLFPLEPLHFYLERHADVFILDRLLIGRVSGTLGVVTAWAGERDIA